MASDDTIWVDVVTESPCAPVAFAPFFAGGRDRIADDVRRLRRAKSWLMRWCHPLTGGLVTCTGAFQFDNVIWMELPGL